MKNNKGFTLIEVLIYTALIGVAGVFLNSTLISVLRLQGQQSASTVVNQQINFVLQNIQKSVRESSLIEMEGNVASTTLTLRMTDEALDPTLIYLSGTTVYIKKGAAAALALTTADVNADQLDFTKVSSYPGHDSVSVDISFSFNTDNPQQAFTKTINSAISRVSGATFDSDILPGADATYSVGSVANRWQNLTLSGDLTVAGDSSFTGNVGIGTDIPATQLHISGVSNEARLQATNGTIGLRLTADNGSAATYLNRATTAFVSGLYFQTAASNDWAIGTGIWGGENGSSLLIDKGDGTTKFAITTAGNVGIGTTTPDAALSAVGFGIKVHDSSGSGSGRMTIGNNTINNGSSYLSMLGSNSVTNWQIGTNHNVSGAFEIMPSTATGGSTFGNAAMLIASDGKIGIGTTSPSQLLSVAGTIYSSVGYRFPDGTTQTTAGGGSTVHVPTRQIFTSGSGTYTTPADVGYIKVRMVGGGGGGGAGATNDGAAGGNTSFNSVVANGGSGGGGGENSFVNGGAGGTGGTGTASFRVQGGAGGGITYGNTYAAISGGAGGNSAFGGGAAPASESAAGIAAAANSGAGGSGGSYSSYSGGGGGGAGEYAELIISDPAATYSYAVGAGGAGGTAGQYAGGAGGSGIIIVDEYYTTALSVDVTSSGTNVFSGASNTFTNGITFSDSNVQTGAAMCTLLATANPSSASSVTFSGLSSSYRYKLESQLQLKTAAPWLALIINGDYGANYKDSASITWNGGTYLQSTGTYGHTLYYINTNNGAVNDDGNMTTTIAPLLSGSRIGIHSAGSWYYSGASGISLTSGTVYTASGSLSSITVAGSTGQYNAAANLSANFSGHLRLFRCAL